MLVPLFALALTGPGSRADVAPDPTKGSALLHVCHAELRLMQPDGLRTAEQADLVNGAYCVGYVNGFISNLAPGPASICIENRPLADLVTAYVSFMDRNPKWLEEDKRVGLRLALEGAFPCPVPSGLTRLPVPSRQNRL